MTFKTPTAAERSDHNLLAVLASLRAGKLNRPDLLAEHEAEAERRGIAHLRPEDIPLPPLPPMPWEVHAECKTWQQVGPCVSPSLEALAGTPSGLTAFEAADLLHHRRPHVIGTRLIELREDGLVERNGATRPTDTGHQAEVYVITALGRQVLEAGGGE